MRMGLVSQSRIAALVPSQTTHLATIPPHPDATVLTMPTVVQVFVIIVLGHLINVVLACTSPFW